VEARLTQPSSEAPILFEAGADKAIAIQLPVEEQPPQSALVARIDRYLRAAGALDTARRSRLTAATARNLLALGVSAEPAWAEIVAAVDRALAGTDSTEGSDKALTTSTTPHGRVALCLAPDADVGAGAGWGAPPRRRSAMRLQDLSLWRPTAELLLGLRVSRPAQGLAACLCWIAILIVP
jgi:hypothetical protein